MVVRGEPVPDEKAKLEDDWPFYVINLNKAYCLLS